ncbi:hypothetical protein QBC37DRAFT_405667 [Rhypophila decipiens]|uniref:Uncharacterized protein n=1 Tax=Rhypophila decipiens TaxID=261697 RepID=A0AAN6XWR3_9PEZI|nr:hypothetical protein QBC37DRAFT_405667 [Rhypophila decipiens]
MVLVGSGDVSILIKCDLADLHKTLIPPTDPSMVNSHPQTLPQLSNVFNVVLVGTRIVGEFLEAQHRDRLPSQEARGDRRSISQSSQPRASKDSINQGTGLLRHEMELEQRRRLKQPQKKNWRKSVMNKQGKTLELDPLVSGEALGGHIDTRAGNLGQTSLYELICVHLVSIICLVGDSHPEMSWFLILIGLIYSFMTISIPVMCVLFACVDAKHHRSRTKTRWSEWRSYPPRVRIPPATAPDEAHTPRTSEKVALITVERESPAIAEDLTIQWKPCYVSGWPG